MNTTARIHRSPRLAVAALVCLGTVALAPAAAHADPGNGQGQANAPAVAPGQPQQAASAQQTPTPAPSGNGTSAGQQSHGHHSNPGQGNPGQGNPGHSNPGHSNPGQGNPGHSNPGQGNPGQGNPGNHADQGGNGGNGGGSGAQQETPADPAGNNGTVKIAPHGEADGIPDNTPHPGCTFQVEWYGFDEGADIVSTVSFAPQAPTADVVIGGTAPGQVFVGGDAATGAGTDTGHDGTQVYTLSFTGEPHPQQGYHVRLTIHTPGSIGNDTKTKVFWVTGCENPVTPETPDTSATPQSPEAPTPTTQVGAGNPDASQVLPEVTAEAQAPEVLGVQAFAPEVAAELEPQLHTVAQAPGRQQALPTAVNAGAAGVAGGAPVSGTTSLLGLLLVVMGAVSARLGWNRVRG